MLPALCRMGARRQEHRFVKSFLFCTALLICAVLSSSMFAQAPPAQAPPPAKENPPVEVATPPAAKLAPGVGMAVDPGKYSIGIQDVLYISVWRQPDFTRLVAVRPDGKITMPLIGDLKAVDITPQELAKEITDKLSAYLVHPEVSVAVQDVRSKRYYIDGEVNRPGLYALIGPTHVMEALSLAGGFRDFANTKKIIILRGHTTYKFNYNDVSRGKNMKQDILLENGDHIIVR